MFDPDFDQCGPVLNHISTPQTQPLLRAAVYDGWGFGLRFAYFDGIGDVLRGFSGRYIGRKEHPYYQYWRFNRQVLDDESEEIFAALRRKAQGCVAFDWEAFSKIIEGARAEPNPSAFVSDIKESIYLLGNDEVVLTGSYHPGVVALAKNMGGRYLRAMKAWKLLQTSAVALKNNLILELRLRDDQVEIFDGEYAIIDDQFSQIKFSEIGITISGEFPECDRSGDKEDDGENEVYLAVTTPLAPTDFTEQEIEANLAAYSLYDYQQTGVRHLIATNSALLADDMGLGKTRQAIVAADILTQGGLKVLIVCPASLIINWSREIAMVIPDASIGAQCYKSDAKWTVTNYERLGDLLKHAHEFHVMITDEAHLLKEPTSMRTRLAFDVASKIPFRFILTGTPILNRECEIHTLLRLSGHPIGNIPLRDFEEQFSGDPQFRNDLNNRIQEWMLRRKKDMVLRTLKGKQHQIVAIEASEDHRTKYNEALNNPDLFPLQKVIQLRQILEAAKLDAVGEMVGEMQADDKVLIFCEFVDTVAVLKERLEAVGVTASTLTGNDSHAKRQRAVDEFQQNPEVRAFIGTTMAAGVGLNLTAANYVIFASLPWTPALKDQAEDRAYRNGQNRVVIVKIPLMDGTIDIALWEMLQYKRAIASEVLDPEEAKTAAQSALAGKLFQQAPTVKRIACGGTV